MAQIIDSVLASEDRTRRAAQLLDRVFWALVVTVDGAVAIVVAGELSSWWALASALGVTAAGGGGVALLRRRRRPAATVPGPRAPS